MRISSATTLSLTSTFMLFRYGTCEVPCIDTLTQLRSELDSATTDNTNPFILCPGSTFDFGGVDVNTQSDALGLKSNATILCGQDGLSSNKCTFVNGYVMLEPLSLNSNVVTIGSVRLQGITFDNTITTSNKIAGDIALVDCIFENNAMASFDYGTTNLYKYVTFDKCQFSGNDVADYLIYGGTSTILTIISSVFEDNTAGECINSLGPTIRIENSCFSNNAFNNARVVSIFNSASVVTTSNFGSNNGGVEMACEFISRYSVDASQSSSTQPECLDYESTAGCTSDNPVTSTAAPTTMTSASATTMAPTTTTDDTTTTTTDSPTEPVVDTQAPVTSTPTSSTTDASTPPPTTAATMEATTMETSDATDTPTMYTNSTYSPTYETEDGMTTTGSTTTLRPITTSAPAPAPTRTPLFNTNNIEEEASGASSIAVTAVTILSTFVLVSSLLAF